MRMLVWNEFRGKPHTGVVQVLQANQSVQVIDLSRRSASRN